VAIRAVWGAHRLPRGRPRGTGPWVWIWAWTTCAVRRASNFRTAARRWQQAERPREPVGDSAGRWVSGGAQVYRARLCLSNLSGPVRC